MSERKIRMDPAERSGPFAFTSLLDIDLLHSGLLNVGPQKQPIDHIPR